MINIASAKFVKALVDGVERVGIVTDVEEAPDGTVGVHFLACRAGHDAFRVVSKDDLVERGDTAKKADVAVDPSPPSGVEHSDRRGDVVTPADIPASGPVPRAEAGAAAPDDTFETGPTGEPVTSPKNTENGDK